MLFSIIDWDPGYYPNINYANQSQQLCYRQIKKRLQANEYVDVGKNDSYLYYYNIDLHNALICAKSKKEIANIRQYVDNFIRAYLQEKPKIVRYFYNDLVFADLLLFMHNDNGKVLYDVNRILYSNSGGNPELMLSAYVSAGNFRATSYIDPSILTSFITTSLRSRMTKLGREHEKDILMTMYSFLDADFEMTSCNFLFKMFSFTDGAIYMNEYGDYGCAELYEMPKNARKIIYQMQVPVQDEVKLNAYLKAIVRGAENLFRSTIGIQQIGEGWVSETLLYRRVEAMLPGLMVEAHASPEFLGRQHYDVYIPDCKIALEYQGIQHFKPIKYFGGEDAFTKNQQRDAKKRYLSEKHGVYQIDVTPGYEIEWLLSELRCALNGKGYKIPDNALEIMKNISVNFECEGVKSRQKKTSKYLIKTVDKQVKKDRLLDEKTDFLIERAEIERCEVIDPAQYLSEEKLSEYRLTVGDFSPQLCFNPHRAITELKRLIAKGYTYSYVFRALLERYHEIGNYRDEMLLLLQMQKKYGWNVRNDIKKLLRTKADSFSDIFKDFEPKG